MTSANENIKSYRIVWKITEKRKNSFSFLQSHKFTIDNSEWTLEMYRFPNCISEYSFSLHGPTKDKEKILKCTYYLLSADKNYKLESFSKFGVNTTPSTKVTHNEAMLVCAFDVACVASARNTEKWLEGRTEELDLVQTPILSESDYRHYSIQCSEAMKQKVDVKLTYDSETSTVKSNATGLDKGECVIVDWCSGTPFCIHPKETTINTNLLGNEIIVWCKSFEFKEMIRDRIFEVADIIKISFTDSLLSKEREEYQTLEPTTEYRYITKFQTMINKVIKAAPITRSPRRSPSAPEFLSNSMHCFRNKQFCNITIKVLKDGCDIRAHKLVLVSGSTVWRQLLTNDQQLSIIIVPDLDRKIVKALITFIYDGSVPKASIDVNQLLIAAATYGVDGLKDWCEQHLIRTITVESAIDLMVLAHRCNASALFEKLVTFVQQNFIELEQRDELKSFFEKYPESATELLKNLCNSKSVY